MLYLFRFGTLMRALYLSSVVAAVLSFSDTAVAQDACFGPDQSKTCIPRSKLKVNVVSARQLRRAGIFPQSTITKNGNFAEGLPVECSIVPNGWGVTISKALFANYRSRGFNSDAICLGLGGEGIHYDPQTGAQIPLYTVAGDVFETIHPARLPDCYRRVERVGGIGSWLIYFRPIGCKMKFHPVTGEKLKSTDQVFLVAGGEAGGGVDEEAKGSTVSEERLRQLIGGR